jgi:alkylated DNA repair dioxygenase AlkB
MMPPAIPQMSLFHAPVAANRDAVALPELRLALEVDHRQWLEWLADEWWPLASVGPLKLWPTAPPRLVEPEDRISIIAWIDRSKLPAIEVPVQRGTTWIRIPLSDVKASDEAILWNGPIPLHSVHSFSVDSEGDLRRIVAMAKGFSNVAVPPRPIRHEPIPRKHPVLSAESAGPLLSTPLLAPPQRWNSARGAAAMALWAVPHMEPWVQTLCATLSSSIAETLGASIEAPFWAEPPWRRYKDSTRFPLWRACSEVMLDAPNRRGNGLLELVSERALMHGAHKATTEALVRETRAILRDEQPISTSRAAADPVGLALQLVLLRPDPARFVEWPKDLRALPPGVWWMSATLCGALSGYRDLEARFRGSLEASQLLAIHTWQQQSDSADQAWPSALPEPLVQRTRDRLELRWGDSILRELPQHARGQWLSASLEDPNTRDTAVQLAKRYSVPCLRRVVRGSNLLLPYRGSAELERTSSGGTISFHGAATIELPGDATVSDDLDEVKFRRWLVIGGIDGVLPPPPTQEVWAAPVRAPRTAAQATEAKGETIPGLRIALDFIRPTEEQELIARVDQSPWSSELSRRVQHYGWRYNYKARAVAESDRLGPLPLWLADLAARLFDRRLVGALPDQVIVNEYVGKQGIAKHTDCLPCFHGAIAMISLGEAWEMNFWPPTGAKEPRVLPVRSVTVLSGIVRERWKHEIPVRKNEAWGPRARRLSLTFRKVAVAARSSR